MSKWRKHGLVILCLLLLLGLGEGIYWASRRQAPTPLLYGYVGCAQEAAVSRRSGLFWDCFSAASRLNQLFLSAGYHFRVPLLFEVQVSEETKEYGADLFQNADVNELLQTEKHNLAYYYYLLFIYAYESGRLGEAEALIRKAVYLSPELSHYHVEYANLALLDDNEEKAREAISYCLKFDYPMNHCQDYTASALARDATFKVGALHEDVRAYYDELF